MANTVDEACRAKSSLRPKASKARPSLVMARSKVRKAATSKITAHSWSVKMTPKIVAIKWARLNGIQTQNPYRTCIFWTKILATKPITDPVPIVAMDQPMS
eukprot:Skav209270  [mRNA]  locus=scaffold1552:191381:192588:- [translate_table: standard]